MVYLIVGLLFIIIWYFIVVLLTLLNGLQFSSNPLLELWVTIYNSNYYVIILNYVKEIKIIILCRFFFYIQYQTIIN